MWQLWQAAKAYGTRPSRLVGIPIDEELLSFMVDDAIVAFGTWLDAKVNERTPDGSYKNSLEDLLYPERVRKVSLRSLAAVFGGAAVIR